MSRPLSSLLLLLSLALCASVCVSGFGILRPPATARLAPPPPDTVSFSTYLRQAAARDPPPTTNSIHVTFVHLNDLYELMPTGPYGGMARVATLVEHLRQTRPNRVATVLGGDLFSPSALSTIPINGTVLDGKQMVAAMNALKLDVATLGNHETDVKETSFRARLKESDFPWLCMNAVERDEYPQIVDDLLMEFHHPDVEGVSAKFGLFGVTMDSNNKSYQSYFPFEVQLQMVEKEVVALRSKAADVVIGLTHLPYWDDDTLVHEVPDIDIVMGGHEHTRISIINEAPVASVFKADSNVHSVWIHDVHIDPTLPKEDAKRLIIHSTLVQIDDSLTDEPQMKAALDVYLDAAFHAFEEIGFHPKEKLATLTRDLVGVNDIIFEHDTELTHLVNLALLQESYKYETTLEGHPLPTLDATLFNAGAIRIDDTIPAGTEMTQYDAIRISPYLNAVFVVRISGHLLKRALDVSQANLGESQHLHGYPNITVVKDEVAVGAMGEVQWSYIINGLPLNTSSQAWYTVGILHYLLEGIVPYTFLNPKENDELFVLAGDETGKSDVRRSILDQIALAFPDAPSESSSTGAPGPSPHPHDNPSRILGLRPWQFGALLIIVLGILGGIAYGCVRNCKREAMRDSQIAIDDLWGGSRINRDEDRRQALAGQYHLHTDADDDMYSNEA